MHLSSRLQELLLTFCIPSIEEIFDIIIDYPDSKLALEDLKECLARVDQRSQLVQSLRKA